MDINNLVIVFAPNLIGCPSSISNGNPDMYLLESTQATNLFKILLENFWTIFDSLIPNLRDLKSIYTDPIKSFNLESYNLEDLSPNKPGRRLNDLPSPTPAETKKFNSIIKSTIQKSLFGKKNKHPEEINEILDIDDHVQNTVPTIPLNASSTGTIRGVHQTLLDELKVH